MYNQKVSYKIYNFRKKFPSDKISDDYLRNKYKRIETLLKSMQSEVIDERPDCYQVLEERDEWITSLDNIEETEEYKEFVDRLNNNSITDESLVKYAKYHFKFEAFSTLIASNVLVNDNVTTNDFVATTSQEPLSKRARKITFNDKSTILSNR